MFSMYLGGNHRLVPLIKCLGDIFDGLKAVILPFKSNFSKGRLPGIDKQNELVSRDNAPLRTKSN